MKLPTPPRAVLLVGILDLLDLNLLFVAREVDLSSTSSFHVGLIGTIELSQREDGLTHRANEECDPHFHLTTCVGLDHQLHGSAL